MEVLIMCSLMKENFDNTKIWKSFIYPLVQPRSRILLFPLTDSSGICFCKSFFQFFQHFQRDIVRGVEGYIVTGSKQVEIGMLVGFSELFCCFGRENRDKLVDIFVLIHSLLLIHQICINRK